ncbi:MAG: putative metalloprotease CJM1_0395 family protein [Pseudomonadota bacterium]
MTSISFNPVVYVAARAQTVQAGSPAELLRQDAAVLFGENGSVSDSVRVGDAVAPVSETSTAASADAAPGEDRQASEASSVDGLTDQEREQVEELQARDREVRAHEQAHLAVAGPYAKGGIQYSFQRGPDGRMYAVGGEVSVDTSEIPDDPQATLRKAQTLRRAALAPAEPSRQDRAVAAQMSRMAAEASREIAAEGRASVASAIEERAERNDPARSQDTSTNAVAREAAAAYSFADQNESRVRITV